MSTLTKVFTLLVSILAILLCGVVVTYIATSADYKKSYEKQVTLTEAATIVGETHRSAKEKLELEASEHIKRLITANKLAQAKNDEQARELILANNEAAEAVRNVKTAQKTMETLTTALRQLQESQANLFATNIKYLNEKLDAQKKEEQKSLRLNSEIVKTQQLDTTRKRLTEQVARLESDIEKLNVKLASVNMTSSEMINTKVVTMTEPVPAGVPIRGEIIDVADDLAAISVGSSSGVREGMRFWIERGGKFLGNLKVNRVEAGEAVGQLINLQGVIVKGDVVTTGFE
ncbi:MAG: hypothetical protein K9M57_09285 [Phycisphaerae bacterium]|nr:hypothetical protein [Phycisphaerae bacterium]